MLVLPPLLLLLQGDGHLDIYITCHLSADLLYLNDGNGYFTSVSPLVSAFTDNKYSKSAAAFDVVHTGLQAVAVGILGGPPEDAVLMWAPDGTVSNVAAPYGLLGSGASSTCSSAVDIDSAWHC